MTTWYRASQNKNIPNVFSGEGGLYTSGRWNHLGRKVIYCSESISLCTLEWLSHNGLSVSGFHYYRYSIEVPDKLIKKFIPSDLPKEWHKTPATDITRDFAETHLFLLEKYLGLALPSVLVPEEFNLVMNPLHKNFSHIMKSIKLLGKHSAPNRNTIELKEDLLTIGKRYAKLPHLGSRTPNKILELDANGLPK